MANTTKKTNKKQVKVPRTLSGTVVSTKMKDTAVVLVDRFVKHPRYEKFLKRSKKIKAHDPGNTVEVGDVVEIEETTPVSKDKHFKIVS